MTRDHIQLTETPMGLTQGFSAKGRASVREDMDSTDKVLTIFHEYAYELLHWTAEGKGKTVKVKECHAEPSRT